MKKYGNTIFSKVLLASVIPFALVFAIALLVIMNIIFNMHRSRATKNVMFFAENATEKIDDNLDHMSALLELTSRNMADAVENSENGR